MDQFSYFWSYCTWIIESIIHWLSFLIFFLSKLTIYKTPIMVSIKNSSVPQGLIRGTINLFSHKWAIVPLFIQLPVIYNLTYFIITFYEPCWVLQKSENLFFWRTISQQCKLKMRLIFKKKIFVWLSRLFTISFILSSLCLTMQTHLWVGRHHLVFIFSLTYFSKNWTLSNIIKHIQFLKW